MTSCRSAHRSTPLRVVGFALLAAAGCANVPGVTGGGPGPGPGPGSGDAPGTLDATFGSNGSGIARVSFGSDDQGSFTDLQVLGTELVVAGTGYGGLGGSRFTVARLTGAGALDPGFAGGTLLRLGFAGSTASYAQAV
ncbi:MAG TPA: hypothetical protein VI072_10985, partial [Polyangiaceae bacterium]